MLDKYAYDYSLSSTMSDAVRDPRAGSWDQFARRVIAGSGILTAALSEFCGFGTNSEWLTPLTGREFSLHSANYPFAERWVLS